MKYKSYLILIVFFSFFSCSKEDVDPQLTSAENTCGTSGKIVKKVKDRPGIVFYNAAQNIYTMFYSVPNSYDLQEVGIVCNLPEELQKDTDELQDGKGLKVTFSGEYIEYGNQPLDLPVGVTYYYLSITNIDIEE